MAQNHEVSRRTMLGLGVGGAAAVALTPLNPVTAFGAPRHDGPDGDHDDSRGRREEGTLIPRERVGTITFTQRDVPGRLGIASGAPTLGHLGGADFPGDPFDLGPLVPLPGGWKELFEYFSKVGIEQVEFAGYGQNPGNPGGSAGITSGTFPNVVYDPSLKPAYLAYARTLRGFLDDNGLEAIGNHGFIPNTWNGPHSAGGTMSVADYDRLQTELEFASILGMPFMGTGGDPASANDRNIETWTIAGEKWEALNRLSRRWDIKMYTHNHDAAYNFLQDGPMVTVTQDRVTGVPIAPTQVRAESGKRLMQHYLDVTSPRLVVVEMDIYWAHVAQHKHRWRYDVNGKRVKDIFDPLATVAKQTHRYPLYHAKDGERTAEAYGVGNGYNMVPFGDLRSDIDYRTFLAGDGGSKYFHNPNYEQDNAPGGAADPGQSLRSTAISAANMGALRG